MRGNDTLNGDAGNYNLNGGTGNDLLDGGVVYGLNGGGYTDTVSYASGRHQGTERPV